MCAAAVELILSPERSCMHVLWAAATAFSDMVPDAAVKESELLGLSQVPWAAFTHTKLTHHRRMHFCGSVAAVERKSTHELFER